MDSSHDSSPERDETLLAEAINVIERYESLRRELTAWNFSVGRISLSRSVGTVQIFGIFVVWHTLALCAGITLIALKSGAELGIALTVGSLFGIGSFISQVWSQGMDREREFIHKVEGADALERLAIVSKQMRDIEKRLDRRFPDRLG
ncbi:hypothetical protein [Amycolatopsis circi]|uniref:hypothetical protein n=1 Tax=Amycolatopsis circi TaxID=871959 RepID=UPI000E24B305|nr:hypothetical protein [Amycolatopsis circi]